MAFHHNREAVVHACLGFLKKSAKAEDKEIVKELFWLFFDGLILVLSLISMSEHFIEHPEMIGVFRLLRVFRVLRVFELSNSLKRVESKMLSVLPTVFIFVFLIFLILYTYAIIGMHLYDYKKIDTLDFSTLYSAMSSLFVIMTNGVGGAIKELRFGAPDVNSIATDIFIFSYFVFSVLITLNVFTAIMASQVQEKIKEGIDEQSIVLKRIEDLETNIQKNINEMNKKMESLGRK